MNIVDNLEPTVKYIIGIMVLVHSVAFLIWIILLLRSYTSNKSSFEQGIDDILEKEEKKH